MIVSNFELLIKRIATVPNSVPSNISTVFRRVVQGYFLMVSNLETNRAITLYLKLTIPTSNGNREMNAFNTQIIFDNGTTNNAILTLTKLSSSNSNFTEYQTGSFTLNSRQTGLITVLPNVFPFINNGNPDLEIRGFVELKQRRRRIFPFPFLVTPKADVLITPETRGTFLDNDYPSTSTSNELDFDQISYGLPIASGKNQNIVERVRPIIINPVVIGDLSSDIFKLKQTIKKDNPDLNEDELEILTSSLTEMKGNKKIKKLYDEINKEKIKK